MSQNVNVIIVEDNDFAAADLTDKLNTFGRENAVGFDISRVRDCEKLLENYAPKYDICFMDIELPGHDGMYAAKRLRSFDDSIVIIFVTNMRQYAIAGYEVGALNYILKPVNYNSFAVTMKRAVKRILNDKSVFLAAKVEGGVRLVDSREIVWVEIMHHDVMIHTAEEEITTYGTLSTIEKQLSPVGFARCSACALVNLRYVKGVLRDDIMLTCGAVHISRRYKQQFMQKLTVYLGEMK